MQSLPHRLFLSLCIISFAVYKKNTYNKQILSMKESMNTLYSDKERLREANESYLSMLHKVEFKESAEDVVAGLRRRINGPGQLSDEDWKRFYNAVDKLYPDFRSIVVGNLADITEQKMQTCYLLRVGFVTAFWNSNACNILSSLVNLAFLLAFSCWYNANCSVTGFFTSSINCCLIF